MDQERKRKYEESDDYDSSMDPDQQHSSLSVDDEGGMHIGDIYIPPNKKSFSANEINGCRLVIKKIVLNNFKNYAGTVEVGPFHERFNVIVADNADVIGNVIDAILFVFDINSSKISCESITNFIHVSEKYPNIEKCSIAVHFNKIIDADDGGFKEVPEGCSVLERIALKNRFSYYKLNGRQMNFLAVQRFFKDYGLNLNDNQLLLIKGEIESVAQMKPKGSTDLDTGILEYLEQSFGTTWYTQSLMKMKEAVDHLISDSTEKFNSIKVVERNIKGLEEKLEEVSPVLEKENVNKFTKNLLFEKYEKEKSKFIAKYNEEFGDIHEEVKKLDEELENENKVQKDKEDLEQQQFQEFIIQQQFDGNIEENLEDLCKNFAEVQNSLTIANISREKKKKELEGYQEEYEQIIMNCDERQQIINERLQQIEQLKKTHIDKQNELQHNSESREAEILSLIEKRSKFEKQLMDLEKKVDEMESKLIIHESEFEDFMKNERYERSKYEEIKTSFSEAENTLQAKINELEFSKKKQKEFKKEIKSTNAKLKQLKKAENEMIEELKNLQTQAQASKLLTKKEKMLTSLMLQKENGQIPGILGRLGDLGAIESKYEVAISTICPKLDYIVVETESTAKECSKYLLNNNLEAADYIVLENLESSLICPIEVPMGTSRLFDLLTVEDDRFLPAFFFALQNTLVIEDKDGADVLENRDSFQCIVSLNGDVLKTSDCIPGTGYEKMAGKINIIDAGDKNEPLKSAMCAEKTSKNVEEAAAQLKSSIDCGRDQRVRLERDLSCLKKNERENEENIKKFSNTIISLKDILQNLLPQIEAQLKKAEEMQVDTKTKKALQTKIDKEKKQLNRAKNSIITKTKNINRITSKIEKIKSLNMRINQNTVSKLIKQEETIIENASKLIEELHSYETNLIKIENETERLQSEIKIAENEILELSKKLEVFDKLIEYAENRALQNCADVENDNLLGDYMQNCESFLENMRKFKDTTTKRNETKKLYDEVYEKRFSEFMQDFFKVEKKLKEIYRLLSKGGDADLQLINTADPFSDGILYQVRQPNKSWENISDLSFADRTLASLAFILALHNYRPSPICFIDGIDAIFDNENISILTHCIEKETQPAQFIVISLRSNMANLADTVNVISPTMENCYGEEDADENIFDESPSSAASGGNEKALQ